MKTYVIMLSQTFPANHPRRGEETKFKQQIINAIFVNQGWNKIAAYPELGDKRHTIRANYDLWKKRIDEVQRGEACLSLRQWEGKPYRSKQIEFARLTNQDGVGIQQVNINLDCYDAHKSVDWFIPNPKKVNEFYWFNGTAIAYNDGLLIQDWVNWFKDYDLSKPLAIIHFTKFRY